MVHKMWNPINWHDEYLSYKRTADDKYVWLFSQIAVFFPFSNRHSLLFSRFFYNFSVLDKFSYFKACSKINLQRTGHLALFDGSQVGSSPHGLLVAHWVLIREFFELGFQKGRSVDQVVGPLAQVGHWSQQLRNRFLFRLPVLPEFCFVKHQAMSFSKLNGSYVPEGTPLTGGTAPDSLGW